MDEEYCLLSELEEIANEGDAGTTKLDGITEEKYCIREELVWIVEVWRALMGLNWEVGGGLIKERDEVADEEDIWKTVLEDIREDEKSS